MLDFYQNMDLSLNRKVRVRLFLSLYGQHLCTLCNRGRFIKKCTLLLSYLLAFNWVSQFPVYCPSLTSNLCTHGRYDSLCLWQNIAFTSGQCSSQVGPPGWGSLDSPVGAGEWDGLVLLLLNGFPPSNAWSSCSSGKRSWWGFYWDLKLHSKVHS